MLANLRCLHHRTCHIMVSLFILTEPKLNFGATEMTSQANAPIWHDWACLPKVAVGTRFFCERFPGFFNICKLLRTIFNYLILCQGLGLRFWEMLVVTITANVLCREWLKDVLRRGVAFAANAVHQQHYTGCVDNGTTR